MTADITVIIPAYNAAGTIARALRSCLGQSLPPSEVIVVDDGSKDQTSEIVAGFGASVRLIRQSNAGPGAARNAAARVARGEWLAFLDADDWWMPDKLRRQARLTGQPGVGVIHCLANVSARCIPDEISFDDLWKRNLIVNSSVLVRKSTFESLGGFIEHPGLLVCEDYNLWLRAAAEGVRISLCRELLTYYRPGFGISSHVISFATGSTRNIEMIAERYGLDPAKVDARRNQIFIDLGFMALGRRELTLARSLLKSAFVTKPGPKAAVGVAAAHLPGGVLDIARRLRGSDHVPPRGSDDPTSLLDMRGAVPAMIPGARPSLMVIVETGRGFDRADLSSSAADPHGLRHLHAAQRIFRRHGIVPTYAVDYSVSSDPEASAPLREFLADGACEIGSRLHTWSNPPIEEAPSPRNAYAGNLPAYLEFEKLAVLTRTINETFGVKPVLYRGGRNGAGHYTARSLKWFGYKVDSTVLPMFDLRRDRGPDFRTASPRPAWCDPDRQLLEIPTTVGLTGALRHWGTRAYSLIDRPVLKRMALPEILRRCGVLDRIRLTPHDTSLVDMKRLARDVVAVDPAGVLVLSFASAVLKIGSGPGAASSRDLDAFLARLDEFLTWFLGDLNGIAATPGGIHALASAPSPTPVAADPVAGMQGVEPCEVGAVERTAVA